MSLEACSGQGMSTSQCEGVRQHLYKGKQHLGNLPEMSTGWAQHMQVEAFCRISCWSVPEQIHCQVIATGIL